MRVIAFLLEQQRAFEVLRRTLQITYFIPNNLRSKLNFCTQVPSKAGIILSITPSESETESIIRVEAKKISSDSRLCNQSSSEVGIIPSGSSSESDTESSEVGEAKSLSSRIEKLPRGVSVASAFRSWMGDGFPVHRGDIFHTINRLRKLKSTKRALEVMEGVIRERPYKPKELDYSFLVEFTLKLHGIQQGETLFSRVASEFQNNLLYNNLVLGCLEKGLIRLSLSYMKKMRELCYSISYLAFNRLIILHSSPTHRKSIPKILSQMRADKSPSCWNICEVNCC